jgi:tetratricopeptide (TPR) repeat protein
MFNHFHFGGYLAYRSWPSRDRLPFVTTQPENIRPAIRAAYPRVFVDSTAWHALDREYGFDIAVLVRDQDPGDRLLDYLDADTSWALVFVDDAAEVLIRRRGPLRALAERDGYRLMPAGVRRRLQVVPEVGVNLGLREQVRIELDHMAASSKENGGALHMLGILDLMDGQYEVGGKRLKEALQRKPFLPRVHELLGVVALERGKPDEALREFGRERAMHGSNPQLEVRTGMAYEARHDLSAARRAYLRALELEPGRPDAMEAVQRLAGS